MLGILLNKQCPGLSETFIKNHIEYFNSPVINAYNWKYLLSSSDSGLRSYYWSIRKAQEYRKLKKYFNDYKVNILLAEYGMTGADFWPIAKKLGVPMVVHFHGHDAYRKSILDRYKYRYIPMFEYASAVISVSTDMTRQLISLGAPEWKVKYNCYGVEIEKYTCRSTQKIVQENKSQFLFVGRFVDKKAPLNVILAFEKVLSQFPRAKLIMVGDGYLLEICTRYVEAKGLHKNVKFLGSVEHEDVLQLMLGSTALVQHSVIAFDGDSEGTPNVILEAGAAGLPVIATRHAGIQDVVMDGETGFLVPEGDIQGMAIRMKELLNDEALLARMSNRVREHIRENYSLKKSLAGLSTVFDKL